MPGAMTPDEFARYLAITRQAESGNRDWRSPGVPMRSPAGAMYAMQVLPSTAQAPGFGIQPAAAQTPQEYNRVGEDMLRKMYDRYAGDPGKMWAAYHSGPGRVDRLSAAYGEGWQSHLGPQGRKYVSSNMAALGKSVPGSAAQPTTVSEDTMPSPLDSVAPQPGQAPAQKPEDDPYSLQARFAETNKNEADQIALNRRILEQGTQALMAKRQQGMQASDWFRLSAAFAAPQRLRGFAGMMDNVMPVIADMTASREEADRGRASALAALQNKYDEDSIKARTAATTARTGISEKLAAERAADARANAPDKGTWDTTTQRWVYRDKPSQTENHIVVAGTPYHQWTDGKYRRINADGSHTVFVLEGNALKAVGTEPGAGGR